MFKRTQVSLAVGAALSAGCFCIVTSATAQTQAQSLDRVEVTGSLIRRIEGETSLPVVTINVEELQKAGVTNAEQAVKFITQAQGGQVTTRSVSSTNGAAAYADLRSLGAQRTLVLLNGKRIVSNPFSSVAVDLNTLPLAAVQRIETLPDGASATYGTDAIAGVINFVTRREYRGVTVGAEVQIPQDSGGEVYLANLLGGFGDLATQGWNVYGSLNYRTQKPLRGDERDFGSRSWIPERGFNALSPTTFPGNYSQTVGAVTTIVNTNPSLPGCLPPTSINSGPTFAQGGTGLGANVCGADNQTFVNQVPEQDQWSAFLRGSLALGANHTAFVEYFRALNTVVTQQGPSPETGLTMTPASPFYPGNGTTPITDPALNPTQPISVSWRTTILGPRANEQENTTQRAIAGVEGSVAGFDYQLAALWSKSEVENIFISGYPQTFALRNGVAGTGGAPFLNPFGPQTPAGLAYLQASTVSGLLQEGEGELRSVNGVLSRQFGMLPGGPMTAALGAEYREEEMLYRTDVPKASQAASSGLAGNAPLREGDRSLSAVALELSFPLSKNFEVNAAVRYDHYSDVGSTVNPKVSFRYRPTEQLLLRGSYNTGFTAPTLTQLNLPQQNTFTATRYNDPVLCPNGVPAPGAQASRDCGLQFQRLQGGNQALQPEESRAWTFGFVMQPVPSFSFGIDYWSYEITDAISTIGDQTIFGDPARYANLFVRCSQAPADRRILLGACQNPGTADPIAYVIDIFQNLGDVETSGIDIQANWQGPATPYGRFSIGVRGTYVIDYEFQVVKGGQFFNPVGNFNAQFGGPVIRYQQVTTLGWQQSAWSASLFHRFLSGYRDQNSAASVAPGFRNNKVRDYSIFDLSASYTGFRNITLRGGILNLLNTDPSFSNQTARFNARGYDDQWTNPIGRAFVLAASYRF